MTFTRQVRCGSCHGTRESDSGSGSPCYSCKGVGIKKDPLFHKESRCNTCDGFGSLIKNPCSTCNGTGHVTETASKEIKFDRFIQDGQHFVYQGEGDQSLYRRLNGKDGDLDIEIRVASQGSHIRRDGQDIYSNHFITLGDSINGTGFDVRTIN